MEGIMLVKVYPLNICLLERDTSLISHRYPFFCLITSSYLHQNQFTSPLFPYRLRRCFENIESPGLRKSGLFHYYLFIGLNIMEVLVIQSYEQALAFTIHFQPAIYGFLIKSILSLFKEERLGTEEDPVTYYFIFDDQLIVVYRL